MAGWDPDDWLNIPVDDLLPKALAGLCNAIGERRAWVVGEYDWEWGHYNGPLGVPIPPFISYSGDDGATQPAAAVFAGRRLDGENYSLVLFEEDLYTQSRNVKYLVELLRSRIADLIAAANNKRVFWATSSTDRTRMTDIAELLTQGTYGDTWVALESATIIIPLLQLREAISMLRYPIVFPEVVAETTGASYRVGTIGPGDPFSGGSQAWLDCWEYGVDATPSSDGKIGFVHWGERAGSPSSKTYWYAYIKDEAFGQDSYVDMAPYPGTLLEGHRVMAGTLLQQVRLLSLPLQIGGTEYSGASAGDVIVSAVAAEHDGTSLNLPATGELACTFSDADTDTSWPVPGTEAALPLIEMSQEAPTFSPMAFGAYSGGFPDPLFCPQSSVAFFYHDDITGLPPEGVLRIAILSNATRAYLDITSELSFY